VTRNQTKPLRLKRKHARKNRHASGLNENGSIERFHMTSRRPYWFTKNNETAAIYMYQANPVGVEVLSYVNTSFC